MHEVFKDAPARVYAQLSRLPDGGGGSRAAPPNGTPQLGMLCGPCPPASFGGPARCDPPSILEPARFEWDAAVDENDIGAVSGGDHKVLALEAALKADPEDEDMDCCAGARVLMALSSGRGTSATSHAARAAAAAEGSARSDGEDVAAEGSACSAEAACGAGVAAQGSVRPAVVALPCGLLAGPAAARLPAAVSSHAASALPPAVLHAIGDKPVGPMPVQDHSMHGSGPGCAVVLSGSGLEATGASDHCRSAAVHVAAQGALPGLQRSVLPLSLHSSHLPAGVRNNVLPLPEPSASAGDLREEERRMTHVDEVAASAKLRFETFGHLFDSLAQPCSSSGGGSGSGAGGAPTLQLSDADTGRRTSRLAPQADASSGQLIEVQQQLQQHSGQLIVVQQQQHSDPLRHPPLSGRPHVGQAAGAPGGSNGSAGDEPAGEKEPAGEAQPVKGGQPAAKRKYTASELTLQIFEEEGCYDMTEANAATHFGFKSATMLKKQFHKLGMVQWPYRQRITFRAMLENAETYIEAKAALHCGPEVQARAAALVGYLRQLYARVLANPLGLCYANCPAVAAGQKGRKDGERKLGCACTGLSQAQQQLRQSLYKLRNEAAAVEASGRWAHRIQKVLDKHGKALEQECTAGVLATTASGHTAAAAAAKPTPEGGSPGKLAGRGRRAQPRRGGRKPY